MKPVHALVLALTLGACPKPTPELPARGDPAVGDPAIGASAAPEAPGPRLAVVLVVDQLPVRLLEGPADLYTSGLQRLTGDQAFVGVARHAHATTFTGPGHATISTGAAPAVNGIVSNDWYVPGDPGTSVYCGDPALLLAGTLADRVIDAGGQVASVSHKDRGATLLGGRRPTLVSWYDRDAMRFTPPLHDLDLSGWMNQPWEALHPEVYQTRVGPDDGPFESDPGHGTTFPHPPPQSGRAFLTSPSAGEALTDAAIAAVDRLSLGADDTPDLLTVSYSHTDYIGHTFTAESWEAMDGIVRLDRTIGRLLAHLDQVVGPDRYVVALTSDHGAIVADGAVRVSPKAVVQAADEALRKAGAEGTVHAEDPGIWLPVPVRSDPEARAKASRAIASAIAAIPGIGGAWAWREDGVDGPHADVIRNSLHEERSGDVYVLLAEGALFDYPGAEGKGTSHGTPFDVDTRVPLLIAGAGVAPGRAAADLDVRQIAPTLARILGIEPPSDAQLGPVDAALQQ